MFPRCLWALVFICALCPAFSRAAPSSGLKHESFGEDPHWEHRNNDITPPKVKPVIQDFGYRTTHYAADHPGELGGVVTRAFAPAFYGDKITPKTLTRKLSASGTFALTDSHAGSGFFFGWFNARQPGGSRPVSSLGLDLDAEKSGGRLAVRLITAQNKSCGTFVTPFTPGGDRPAPIRNDGTRYSWTFSYDPGANSGKGRFEFSIHSNSGKQDAFENKTFSVDLPEGFKNQETTFDCFGLMNEGRPGGALTVFFTDLTYDGRTQSFSGDPHWDGSGNHRTYQPDDVGGAHHYGYSPQTSFAGGSPGEIGGVLWRTEKNFGWYADAVGLLTLNDKLEASGRVVLAVGAPDSGAAFGWFSHRSTNSAADKTNFVGILIGGPTRIGHYFVPACVTAKGHRAAPKQGPILIPGKPYQWKLLYDPAANDGNGSLQLSLDDESVSLNIELGWKQEGALLDRFGLLSTSPGGGLLKIYFDDLTYTTAAP